MHVPAMPCPEASSPQRSAPFRFCILSAPSSTMPLSLSATDLHLKPACAPCYSSAHQLPGIKLCLLSAVTVNPA